MNVNTEADGPISVEEQLLAVTELLGQVLLSVGEPVVVTYESLAGSLPKGARIVVDDHVDSEEYVLYVEVENDSD